MLPSKSPETLGGFEGKTGIVAMQAGKGELKVSGFILQIICFCRLKNEILQSSFRSADDV